MTDLFRPRYHFTAPKNWLNDPNGLVYYEGEYHLFYQADPEAPVGTGRKWWGHAVSADLISWAHLPIALAPDRLGSIWSGSAIVDWRDSSGFFEGGHGLVAIFTQWNDGAQSQSLAFSRDRGRTWATFAGNPVLPDPGYGDFRDPKVFWHAPTGRWAMILAAGDRAVIYTSPNLRDWTFASEFGADQGAHHGVWECPDLFPLPVEGEADDERWVMPISVNGPGGSATQYFVGHFDGAVFNNANAPATTLWADHGRDNYAAVSWSDLPPADGRRLWIGWMSNWQYAGVTPTAPWRGALTVPRQVTLRRNAEGVRLAQAPVTELRALRGAGRAFSDVHVGAGATIPLPFAADACEIIATFALGSARECGLLVRVGAREHTRVGYDVATASVFVDRTDAGESAFHPQFAGRHAAPLAADGGKVTLHIFLDRCSVEVFGNGGTAVITDLIFPRADSVGVALYAHGGDAIAVSVEIYPMAASSLEGGIPCDDASSPSR
jgi:fructan beta-fructosidase